MADYIVSGEHLTAIGNAIRNKTGSTGGILVKDMADSIANLSGGGTDRETVRIYCNYNPNSLVGIIYVDLNHNLQHVSLGRDLLEIEVFKNSIIGLSTPYTLVTGENHIQDGHRPILNTNDRYIYSSLSNYYPIGLYITDDLFIDYIAADNEPT